MSDTKAVRRLVAASLVLLSSVVAAQTRPRLGDAEAAAQSEQARAELFRRDSIAVRRDAELSAIERGFAAADHSLDVTEGLFHVRAAPPLAAAAQRGARLASNALAGTTGADLRRQLAMRVPVFGIDTAVLRHGMLRGLWVAPDTGREMVRRTVIATTLVASEQSIADRLVLIAEEIAATGMDSSLAAWIRARRIPLSDGPRRDWEQAYVEMAASPSTSVRRCLRRDRDACLTSLGLGTGAAPTFSDWYQPEDIPALLTRVDVSERDTTGRRIADRCRGTSEPAACHAVLAHIDTSGTRAPFSATTRMLFLGEVLRSGGPEAYARLSAAQGTLRTRLTSAAAVPLDRVVDRWYARVIDARPRAMPISPLTFVVAVGWCCAFTAIALSRKVL